MYVLERRNKKNVKAWGGALATICEGIPKSNPFRRGYKNFPLPQMYFKQYVKYGPRPPIFFLTFNHINLPKESTSIKILSKYFSGKVVLGPIPHSINDTYIYVNRTLFFTLKYYGLQIIFVLPKYFKYYTREETNLGCKFLHPYFA